MNPKQATQTQGTADPAKELGIDEKTRRLMRRFDAILRSYGPHSNTAEKFFRANLNNTKLIGICLITSAIWESIALEIHEPKDTELKRLARMRIKTSWWQSDTKEVRR